MKYLLLIRQYYILVFNYVFNLVFTIGYVFCVFKAISYIVSWLGEQCLNSDYFIVLLIASPLLAMFLDRIVICAIYPLGLTISYDAWRQICAKMSAIFSVGYLLVEFYGNSGWESTRAVVTNIIFTLIYLFCIGGALTSIKKAKFANDIMRSIERGENIEEKLETRLRNMLREDMREEY